MSQVIVFPRGQLTAADRDRLDLAGVIAVEADDPSSIVTMLPGMRTASPDDILMAALAAVERSPLDSVAAHFVKVLRHRLAARESKEVPNG